MGGEVNGGDSVASEDADHGCKTGGSQKVGDCPFSGQITNYNYTGQNGSNYLFEDLINWKMFFHLIK